MFQVGDYVVYGMEGVCRIEQIGYPQVSGLDPTREYYRLQSHYRKGVIYAPVGGKVPIREPISAEAAEAAIAGAASLALLADIPQNGREAGDYYKAILQEHDVVRLIQLCKTMQRKQEKMTKSRRTVNTTELRHWKTAEDMLLGELAFSLRKDPTEIRDRLRQQYLLTE